MPGLIIWKNRELDRMKRDMDRLMSRLRNDFGTPLFPRAERAVPYFEFLETDDALILKADATGVDPENLDVHIIDNNLIMKGVLQKEFVDERDGYRRTERRRGTFTRTLQIPCKIKIDEVEAHFREGILHVIMPKCRPETARKIKVQIG